MGFDGKIDRAALTKAIRSGNNPELIAEAARRGGIASAKARRKQKAAKAERDAVFAQMTEEERREGAAHAALQRRDFLLPLDQQ